MERILISRYLSPAGEMIIGAHGGEVCLCDWAVESRRGRIDGRICRGLNAVLAEGMTDVMARTIAELDEYFAGLRKEFTVPVRLTGSEFQRRVWQELMRIGYGTTVTYGELARRIGNPKAVRAVAGACGANVRVDTCAVPPRDGRRRTAHGLCWRPCCQKYASGD